LLRTERQFGPARSIGRQHAAFHPRGHLVRGVKYQGSFAISTSIELIWLSELSDGNVGILGQIGRPMTVETGNSPESSAI